MCELKKVEIILETGKPTLYIPVIKRNEVQALIKVPSENGLKAKKWLLDTDRSVKPNQTSPPRAVSVSLFINTPF